MTSSTRRQWLVPVGLVLLSAVPVLAGAARVGELTGGAEVTADNARFLASPVPVLVHIVGATLYCLLGALQFVPALRRRRIAVTPSTMQPTIATPKTSLIGVSSTSSMGGRG